jgi:hypothetical protein
MATKVITNREFRQRRFLKQIEKLIPEIIAALEDGSVVCAAHLGCKHLSDGRVMELQLEARLIDTRPPDVSRRFSKS